LGKNVVAPGALPVVGLTCIRLVVAVFWLSQFTWKPPPTFGCPDSGFCLWLDRAIASPLSPAFADVLRLVVRPYAFIFEWLVLALETTIGASLFLGLLTRLGGLLGTLWSIVLCVGFVEVPGTNAWYYVSLILLNLLFYAIGGTAQVSVDRLVGWRNRWSPADYY
jgi:hypothetical protein